MTDSIDMPLATFKKREIKRNKNIRREIGTDEGSSKGQLDNEEEINVSDIKIEQCLRKRKNGIDIENIASTSTTSKVSKLIKTPQLSDSESAAALGTQFTAQERVMADGGSNHLHEKIMEQYISERIGALLPKPKEEVKPLSEEEKLYLVPEEIKRLQGESSASGSSTGNGKESDMMGGMTTWSTGLAEVTLPLEFKLKNIEATEAARKALEEERARNRVLKAARSEGASSSTLCIGNAAITFNRTIQNNKQLANNNNNNNKLPAASSASVLVENRHDSSHINTDSSYATNTNRNNSNNSTSATSSHTNYRYVNGMQQSTDDLVLNKFKKQQMNRKFR